MEKRGRTTGFLYQRAREREESEGAGYVRTKIHRDTALRQRRRESDTDTERRECTKIYINEMTNNTQPPTMRRGVGYNRTGRRTDADTCSLTHRKEGGWRCSRKRTGIPQSSASLPKPAQTKAMELGGKTEREASGFGPTTLPPLYARDSSFLLVSLLL